MSLRTACSKSGRETRNDLAMAIEMESLHHNRWNTRKDPDDHHPPTIGGQRRHKRACTFAAEVAHIVR
jgi:hypothetical protein